MALAVRDAEADDSAGVAARAGRVFVADRGEAAAEHACARAAPAAADDGAEPAEARGDEPAPAAYVGDDGAGGAYAVAARGGRADDAVAGGARRLPADGLPDVRPGADADPAVS